MWNRIKHSYRRAAGMAAALLTVLGCYSLPSRRDWKPLIGGEADLARVLESVRGKYGQPALAVAVVHGETTLAAAVGRAVIGDSATVDAELSRFHIGSTTKSMTALLVGILVREGKLRYDMTLAEALPDVPLRSEYRSVTLHQLLLNRAGLLAYHNPDLEDKAAITELTESIPAREQDPVRQRALVAAYALGRTPLHKPGTKALYSNVGWSIAGHIAERAAGIPFERLLRERIFQPLGMRSARVGGWPAEKTSPEQPRGHYVEASGLRPQPFDDPYTFGPWMNPAGGVHCNIADFANYAREHLLGLQGKGLLMGEPDYALLHTIHMRAAAREMYLGNNDRTLQAYGYGWVVVPIGRGSLSAADGSGGTFYARVAVLPELNLAFVGFTNAGNGERALSAAVRRVTGLPWN